MKFRITLLAFVLSWCLSAAPQPRSEQVFSKTLRPGAYYPAGESRGYYYPGEKPHFILELKNTAFERADVSIHTVIRDFDGNGVCTVPEIRKTLEADKVTVIEFDLPAPRKKGFYVLNKNKGSEQRGPNQRIQTVQIKGKIMYHKGAAS